MRFVKHSNAFKRSYALMKKRGKNTRKIQEAIRLLAHDLPLPISYKDHPLIGNFSGFRDIHIEPDWILIYRKNDDSIEHPEGELLLEITGTHSDLFS